MWSLFASFARSSTTLGEDKHRAEIAARRRSSPLTRRFMTKEELIALVREGKGNISEAYTITRYCISRERWQHEGRDTDYPAIFMSISNEDGSVYGDDAYFTDRDTEVSLTDDEAEVLREAITRYAATV
jgi:hypothetical protein